MCSGEGDPAIERMPIAVAHQVRAQQRLVQQRQEELNRIAAAREAEAKNQQAEMQRLQARFELAESESPRLIEAPRREKPAPKKKRGWFRR